VILVKGLLSEGSSFQNSPNPILEVHSQHNKDSAALDLKQSLELTILIVFREIYTFARIIYAQ